VKALSLLLAALVGCPASTPSVEGAGSGQGTSVGPAEAATAEPNPQRTLVSRYDLDEPASRWELPGRLDEISGLAVTPDGRLFAHDDERGRVHEIDPANGSVGKRFDLGQSMARDDFEGIAIAGERFFLVSSQGWLYEFREVEDERPTPYRVTDSGLGARCEVEGLDYDRSLDALLLACKVSVPDRRAVIVHRLPLDPDAPRLQPLVIAKSQLRRFGLDPVFEASAIAVDPTGTVVLVSGPRHTIIEVDRTGALLAAYQLSGDRHPQAEGVAFGPDGALYVADERNGDDAYLTVYAPTADGGPPSR
jgi:uncharacterized protein YjiK